MHICWCYESEGTSAKASINLNVTEKTPLINFFNLKSSSNFQISNIFKYDFIFRLCLENVLSESMAYITTATGTLELNTSPKWGTNSKKKLQLKKDLNCTQTRDWLEPEAFC